jgi:hypothetical protein
VETHIHHGQLALYIIRNVHNILVIKNVSIIHTFILNYFR